MNAPLTDRLDPEIDPRQLRDCCGQFATGVAVITTRRADGTPVGLVANSFSSVSLDPPLILWSLGLGAPSLSAFRAHSAFAVNVMGADDLDLTMQFARPSDDKFAGVDWHGGYRGVPVLTNALARIECRVESRVPGGDHEIYLGRVQRLEMREGAPLLFHRGSFAKLGEALK